jgi:hypothetical protein
MKRAEGELVGSLAFTAAVAVVAYTVAAVGLGVAFAIPVGVIGLIASAVVLRGPLGKALARRLEGSVGPDPAALEEATTPLVAHIDELRGRMAELEERVDFAERLLTRQRDAERIAGGPGA